MKKWDGIQQAAIGSHGIITFARAKALGVHPVEIYRWVASGRLMKLNRGVFRLTAYRLEEAIDEAGEKGYFLPDEKGILKSEVLNAKATAQ